MDEQAPNQGNLVEIIIKLAGSLTEEDLIDPANYALASQLVQMLDPKADPLPQEMVDQLKQIQDKATRFKMAAQAIGANRPDLMDKLIDSMKAAGLWKSDQSSGPAPIFEKMNWRKRNIQFSHHDAKAEEKELNKSNPPVAKPFYNNHIRSVADSYAESKGIKLQHDIPKVKVNPEFAGKVASAYQGMEHGPAHPHTKAAYDALIDETTQQLHHLQRNGYKFSPIKPGQANPYASGSAALHADLKDNKHAHYYPTEQGFGSGDSMHPDHPLLREVTDLYGNKMPANDAFRIVHDVFGHSKEGHSFGPQGEEAAYRHHYQMFSPLARRALTSETRGQNSWVNFGPHGANNRTNPEKTVFADQKAGLLPSWAEEHYSDEVKKSEESLDKSQDKYTKKDSGYLEHYSVHSAPLDTIDPNFHGTGAAGEERKRYGRPSRSYYYDKGTKTEDRVTGPAKFKYIVKTPSKILDLNTKEADKHYEAAKTSAGIVDHTELEHSIKNAGYDGYRHSGSSMPNVVALFHPQKPIETHGLSQVKKSLQDFKKSIENLRKSIKEISHSEPGEPISMNNNKLELLKKAQALVDELRKSGKTSEADILAQVLQKAKKEPLVVVSGTPSFIDNQHENDPLKADGYWVHAHDVHSMDGNGSPKNVGNILIHQGKVVHSDVDPEHQHTDLTARMHDYAKKQIGPWHGPGWGHGWEEHEVGKEYKPSYMKKSEDTESLEKGKNRREQQAKVFGGWKTSPDSPRRAKQMNALEEQGKRRYGLGTEKAPGKKNSAGKIIDKPTFDNPGNKIQHIGNPDSLVHEHAHLEVEKEGSGLKQMQADMDHEWGAQNKKYGYKQQARAKDEYSTTALENPLRRRAGLPAHQKETKEKNPKRDYAADEPGKKITHQTPDGKKLTGTSSNRAPEHNRRMDQVDRGELKFHPEKGWQPGTGANSKINQRARSVAENPANAGRKDAKTLMRGEDGSKPISFNDMKKNDLEKSNTGASDDQNNSSNNQSTPGKPKT